MSHVATMRMSDAHSRFRDGDDPAGGQSTLGAADEDVWSAQISAAHANTVRGGRAGLDTSYSSSGQFTDTSGLRGARSARHRLPLRPHFALKTRVTPATTAVVRTHPAST